MGGGRPRRRGDDGFGTRRGLIAQRDPSVLNTQIFSLDSLGNIHSAGTALGDLQLLSVSKVQAPFAMTRPVSEHDQPHIRSPAAIALRGGPCAPWTLAHTPCVPVRLRGIAIAVDEAAGEPDPIALCCQGSPLQNG